MRFNEGWLREWVDPPVDTRELAEQLTRAGLEVDSVEPAVDPGAFAGVVVAEVLECGPHPNADRLKLCVVDPGRGEPVEVVCGAPNARAGMRAVLAPPGSRIGGGVKVRRAKIRGIASQGMLLSMRELGIGDEHDGIIELDAEAVPGADVFGRARSRRHGLRGERDPGPGRLPVPAGHRARGRRAQPSSGRRPPAGAGRARDRTTSLVSSSRPRRGVPVTSDGWCSASTAAAKTPLWMSERLRRCGVRAVSPVVDVTNYVMLELGQPLHAFDLHRLEGGIRVRRARAGERLTLLDEREVELRPSTLVIADHRRRGRARRDHGRARHRGVGSDAGHLPRERVVQPFRSHGRGAVLPAQHRRLLPVRARRRPRAAAHRRRTGDAPSARHCRGAARPDR